mmetsp:Transcript_26735/g.39540  ORF Transcript_26735/g.39540 Transcript_26735/m.39540 type:complete len:411 (-) Transcript_26735:53-1285(-)|eukprot:CAMPEP_0194214410 /NCGR_PEP_ID=MMETSP0156-20130528/15563_1 /TAXON_ID=33649 /ORGANISM="Thalassionema nitzschioides, Strain L26-B" /LENGTH=410 /DNA_ID=CAMNT_0038942653 /DNA_START=72 /DNA_END=1301 /DNA_ORIENTATION=+
MGKKRKNVRKPKQGQGQKPKQSRKRRKVNRYWIEDCVELEAPPGTSVSLDVTITRVNLFDDHTHGPGKKPIQKPTKKESVEGDQTKDSTVRSKPILDVPGCVILDAKSIDEAFIAIRRDKSAQEAFKFFPFQNFKPLANGDCGDGIINPHDKSHVPDKYWAQRKRFFSRYDDGIRLDDEGWFSVTPEKIARHTASRLTTSGKSSLVLLDTFCGCGGNSIAFAQRDEVSMVVAVDSDKEKLELAANNASVYNIPKEKLLFIHGNACEVIEAYKAGKLLLSDPKESSTREQNNDYIHGYRLGDKNLLPEKIDSIFLSPPWGGMDYEDAGKRNYHIETSMEIQTTVPDVSWNGEQILQACAAATNGPLLFFLPRNINGISLGRSALKAGYKCMEMEQNVLNNKLKTVSAYFGM